LIILWILAAAFAFGWLLTSDRTYAAIAIGLVVVAGLFSVISQNIIVTDNSSIVWNRPTH